MGYGSGYKFARKQLEERLKAKEVDFAGSLKEVIEKMDEWFLQYFDLNPQFRIEFNEEHNCIVICHYQTYEIYKVETKH